MSREAEIQRGLKELTKVAEGITSAEVLSINKTDKTIVIKTIDGLEIPDVRLRSVIKDSDAFVMYPTKGSSVLVSPFGNQSAGLYKVVGVEQIDGLEGKIGTVEFEVDADGYKIKRGTENLKTVINDLIAEVSKIIVIQGTTINVAAMSLINDRVNKILK